MTLIKGKRQTNRECSARYTFRHPERRRQAMREYTQRKRMAAVAILGGVCKYCGFNDIRALQIDHINGGGTKELKKFQGALISNLVIKSVLKNENKYQLLCANCNWIKRDTNKEVGYKIKEKHVQLSK